LHGGGALSDVGNFSSHSDLLASHMVLGYYITYCTVM
jgi:hypothetical protein